MASWDHEGIAELFRRDPRLAADLLRDPLGITLPALLWLRRAVTIASVDELFS